MRAKWNEETEKILIDNFPNKSINEMMSLLPQFNKEQIRNKAKKLGVKKEVYEIHFWTDEEDEFIKSNYKELTAGEMAKKLGLSISQVRNRVNSLNLKKQKMWSKEDEEILKENFNVLPIEKLNEILSVKRESTSIRKKAMELGVITPQQDRAKWSEEDIALLKKMYAIKTNEELQNEFFPYYTIAQIKRKARLLGLKKTNLTKYKANLKGKEKLKNIWTDEEKQILVENYGKMNNKVLQRDYLPNKTLDAIKKKAEKLKIQNKTYQYFIWKNVDVSLDEEDFETISFTFEKDLVQ